MKLELLNQTIDELKSDIHLLFLKESDIEKDKNSKLLTQAGFKAEQDSISFLHEKEVLVVGVEKYDADSIRSATATAIKSLKSTNYTSVKTELLDQTHIDALVEGFILGGYDFDFYKSKPKPTAIETISITCHSKEFKDLKKSFEDALIVAKATAFTRDIVNKAPQEINPETLALLAKKLAFENKMKCNVLDEEGLLKENMHSMLAVGRASIHQSQLIHIAYKPKNPKKVISLVGKGLTYDSGGLSLKPSSSMVTMKMDKAGACAVLGIMKAVSELELDVEVHGFIGAVENMVGGNAYKPDDVLVSRSKTTIEVRNTDAEGRLVLADVLDYAQEKVQADNIFDFATLTGACLVALGQYTTGVMGHSNKLKHTIYQAANNSGELVGGLPFNKHLKKLLKSEIADISNVSTKPYGGAITAGLFLDKFIKEENKDKWLHFDIAGSAYTESAWDCNVYGGTGAGVRLICSYLKNIE